MNQCCTSLKLLRLSDVLSDFTAWMMNLSVFFWLLATLIIYILLADFTQSIQMESYYIIVLSAMGVGNMISRLSLGLFLNQFPSIDPLLMNAASIFINSLTILSLLLTVDGVQLVVQCFLFSVTFGFQCVFLAIVPRHIYGKHNMNLVFGIVMFFGGVGSLIGSPSAG